MDRTYLGWGLAFLFIGFAIMQMPHEWHNSIIGLVSYSGPFNKIPPVHDHYLHQNIGMVLFVLGCATLRVGINHSQAWAPE